jgi:phage terminase large subunit GpA-like protein
MSAEALLETVTALYAPPSTLTVSEFADRELVVTAGPLAGTHWRTDFTPYLRGILDAFHEPGVEVVVVQAASQVGKTAAAVAVVAYHMIHDPSPILVVEPTVDPMAEDFSRNRLRPMIEASPTLRERVGKRRAKDTSNTTLAISFRGGDVAIGGANSAASLAARSRRVLILDEVDRYPPELPGEGSTIALAMKRTAAYRHRRRILMLSSPTLRGGTIDTWFQRGDQRRFHVPCPQCGVMHPLQWAHVRWVNHDPTTARLHCPACDHGMDDAERLAAVAQGTWHADHPHRSDRTIVSFHLWEAYSPFSSLADLVAAFLRAQALAKTGDRTELHTWQNTTLGEPVEPDAGEGVEPHVLLLRREAYDPAVQIPSGISAITMGVDVQDDRLEGLVVGWGPGEESWLLDRATIPGDTSHPQPWKELDAVLSVEFRHQLGPRLRILATCLDSAGHRTSEVYEYCHRWAARRVYATIGRAGEHPLVSSATPRRWGRGERQVPLYTIGVDAAKAIVMSRLALTEKGPAYVHLPATEWADEELALQLTSERLVTGYTRGIRTTAWKKIRMRNEALDCLVLAYAALRLLNPRLDLWMAHIKRAAASGVSPTAPSAAGQTPAPVRRPRPRRFTRSTYMMS